MSTETTKKNDALENVKQIEKYGEDFLKPILTKISDAKASVKSIYEAAKQKHESLREQEFVSSLAVETQPVTDSSAEKKAEPNTKEAEAPSTQINNTPTVTTEQKTEQKPATPITNVEKTQEVAPVAPKQPAEVTPTVTESKPQYVGSDRKPYDPNNRPPYDPNNRPQYTGERKPYDPNNRPPYDPNNRPQYTGERKPYDPNNRPPYDPNNRPQYTGERKPYDPNNRPPYDPNNRPQYTGERKPYDPNNRPPYDPNNRPQYTGERKPYDPNNRPPYDPNNRPQYTGERKPYDPNNRPPYDPNNRPQYTGERKPYDPNNRPPYTGERRPYDPNNRPPYTGERKPYDPNNRPPYTGERKPFDPNNRGGSPRPFDKNKGTGARSEFVPPIGAIAKDTKAIDKKKLETKKFEDARTAKKVKSRGVEYSGDDYEGEGTIHFKARRGGKKQAFIEPLNIKIEHAIVNTENVPIKLLSEKIGKTGTEIIKTLFLLNIIKTINESIDFSTAQLVSDNFGITLELKRDQTFEEKLEDSLLNNEIETDYEEKRPPIVTVMGHVDHGKTSILDFYRRASVASGEAGGITQHIGAYTVNLNGNPITFLDTPGHEAFTTLRARGAQVTDIAVIVVAAEDGIMPQTIEAIKHAKAAKVSILVAVNKMDKPGATIDKVLQQLTQYELLAEEWGGDTIVVPVSAKTGMNMDKLLESILLLADVLELKANPNCMARGTIIETKLDSARGAVATMLIEQGTLKVSDYIVSGKMIGKIRAMIDDKGRNIKSAGPSIPVSVLGFSELPSSGDTFNVVRDEKLAKQVAEERKLKESNTANFSGMTKLDDFFKNVQDGQIKDLNVIIKADVNGSLEALRQELVKINNEEVRVNIIHGGVGAINESDIMLAKTSGAIVIGFNVRPDTKAKAEASRSEVDVRAYRIIYEVLDDIQKEFNSLLQPITKETIVGHAQVRAIFKVTGAGIIAGCMVTDGKITRHNKLRLTRDGVLVCETSISSLKRMKEDVKDVSTGYECGIGLENCTDVKENDVLECFVLEVIAR